MNGQQPIKVLVVEDDTDLAEMVCLFLNSNGITTILASDGKEAQAILKSTTPDAVILDIILPYIDGITLLSRLRADACDIPIIMLTQKKSVEDILCGFETGADDYITKPFSPRELLNRIHLVLERYHKNKAEMN